MSTSYSMFCQFHCNFNYSSQEVQRAGVQYIIESVIKELARDETKKFIQVIFIYISGLEDTLRSFSNKNFNC